MHRLSNPWRFSVLDRSAIARLATWLPNQDHIVNSPDPDKGPRKLAKLLDRLPQLGAMIQVTWLRHSDPVIDHEDHAAAAAAVQTLLLAAEARGLASFWSSNPALRHDDTLRWCGCDPAREGFLASIWLGQPIDQPAAPPRLPLDLIRRHL
jgi:nitroreductase